MSTSRFSPSSDSLILLLLFKTGCVVTAAAPVKTGETFAGEFRASPLHADQWFLLLSDLCLTSVPQQPKTGAPSLPQTTGPPLPPLRLLTGAAPPPTGLKPANTATIKVLHFDSHVFIFCSLKPAKFAAKPSLSLLISKEAQLFA